MKNILYPLTNLDLNVEWTDSIILLYKIYLPSKSALEKRKLQNISISSEL